MQDSWQSLKKDLAKHKIVLVSGILVLTAIIISSLVFSAGYLSWGLNQVDNKNSDYKVEKLMWSTQEALEDYYKKNNVYPNDLRNLLIKHTDDSYKITGPNEIEYIGHKIIYVVTDDNSYTLETELKMNKERYVLYGDK